jgi:hypothetical protein
MAPCDSRRSLLAAALAAAALAASGMPALRAQPITPDDPGVAALRFTINATTGARQISPYIYGMNFFNGSTFDNAGLPVPLDRLGGNRYTGYNWETNASNAGRDWYYQNDTYMGTPGAPGKAVFPALDAAAAKGRAVVVTVPISGYVAGDSAGPVTRAQALDRSRFKEIVPMKSTIYPGSSLSLTPNTSDGYVFTDEFVNWVDKRRNPSTPVFYSLDNEPGLWGEPLPEGWQPGIQFVQDPSPQGRTHGVLHPYAPTFAELRQKTIDNARAIKSVNPSALVFGGVGYGWNDFVSLQGAPDANAHQAPSHPGGDQSGEMHFYEYLLHEVALAEQQYGPLMDVLDLHWYPEAQGGGVRITENNNSAAVVAARVQAARSLWDPTYVETSWISQWGTWQGSPGTPGPVRLLPRVQRDIDDFKPGTKIAITEYNYGGTNHISGAIAQADALGVFGREGVFAASFWSLHGDANSQFAAGAFKMFLDYDGAAGAGQYGDTAVTASTSNIAESAVYASVDSDDPMRMVLIAINRTNAAKEVGLAVTAERRFDLAEAYQLTSASSNPVRRPDVPITQVNAFRYTMPAMSVTTLVLRSFADGDFDMNGVVDDADFRVWQMNAGLASGARFADGDNDRDGDVDAEDFLAWQRNVAGGGPALTPLTASVPEPAAAALAVVAGMLFVVRRANGSRAPQEASGRPVSRRAGAASHGG